MSRSPFQLLYSLLRRPYSARSTTGSSGDHASGEGSTTTAPARTGESRTDTADPSALVPGGAAMATASSHSNGGAAPAIVNGVDRRAFEGEERLLDHPHAPRQYPLDPEREAEVLVLLAQQYSVTSVTITHYRVKESYVEYVIECVRGHDAWRVYRRYQQFKALDHDLKQLCSSRHGSSHGGYGVVPVLPGSHWMDVTNQSPELVEQRRRYLEIYLQQLLVPKNLFYVARTQLYDFLHDGEVPTHVKLSGIQPLLGLISTRTECASNNGVDEAILREQQETQFRQEQQSLNATEGAATAVQGSASHVQLPLPMSDSTFPTFSTDCAGSAGAATDSRSPEAPDCEKVEASSREAATATTTTTSSVPASATASVTNRESPRLLTTGRVGAGVQITGAAVLDEASADGGSYGAEGRSNYANDTNEVRLARKCARILACGAAFTAVDPMQTGFPDERLPPASANCAQCNAEFTSFLYPRRCFFCLFQFCSACLEKLSVLEGPWLLGRALATSVDSVDSAPGTLQAKRPPSADAKATGGAVPACRQCAENYSRRLDRCDTEPGGGAYRGMQSTLSTPAQSGPLVSSGRSSPSPPVAGSLPAPNMRSCVGEETSSMMLPPCVTNSASVTPNPRLSSPRGYFAGPSSTPSPVDFHDFQLLTVIGRGTFGRVLKVQMRATQKVYAMKIMNKATVYRRCMTSYMKEEKAILTSIRPHPYIVRCHYAFQTEYYLVFVIDYLPGGELYDYIYPRLNLSPGAARIYAAELVLALESLHRQDVVHRDLKPENVVLAADGHICLTDFGLARRAFSRSRRRSFVGSPEYVAPETIQGQVQTAAVDWWSFGVMLYEMLAGKTPFHARNNNTVYENVLHKELELPVLSANDGASAAAGATAPPGIAEGAPKFRGFSPEAVSLLTGLLARDPAMRLQDADTIKRHPFFRGLNWEDLRRRRVPAPCIPGDMRDNDVRHFKREFVSEWASVPPLTNMTRASIEALAKCFDNFPVSCTAALAESAPVDCVSTTFTSAAFGTPSATSCSPQQVRGGARVLSLSLTLPPSVLSTDVQTLREPVRFFHSMSEAQRSFHGTWRVVSIEVHAVDDSRVIFPWGGDVSGVLVYSTGGHFSLQLTPSSRRPIGPVQRVTQLSKEDLCDTFCSYVASFGSFHLFPSSADDGCGVVRHFAEGNLCPNLMLTNTVFQYCMHTEPLHLSTTKEGSRNAGSRRPGGAASPIAATASTARTPSTTDAEDGSGGGAGGSRGHVSEGDSPTDSEDEEDEREMISDRTAILGGDSQQHGGDTASSITQSAPSPRARERRLLLRLSTRPQRAPEQDFLAFTSLVFEKMS